MPGKLKEGTSGSKKFGVLELTWEITMDGIKWQIQNLEFPRDPENEGEVPLSGFLKYKGWNRIQANDSGCSFPGEDRKPNNKYQYYSCYAYEWHDMRRALNFLYHNLGRKIAHGTYEFDGFWRPRFLNRAGRVLRKIKKLFGNCYA